MTDAPCAAERHAGDASTSAPAGALSIIDSTDDVFAEFCAAQVELVARALGATLAAPRAELRGVGERQRLAPAGVRASEHHVELSARC